MPAIQITAQQMNDAVNRMKFALNNIKAKESGLVKVLAALTADYREDESLIGEMRRDDAGLALFIEGLVEYFTALREEAAEAVTSTTSSLEEMEAIKQQLDSGIIVPGMMPPQNIAKF